MYLCLKVYDKLKSYDKNKKYYKLLLIPFNWEEGREIYIYMYLDIDIFDVTNLQLS